VVARTQWKWPLWLALSVTAVFLFVDIAFFAANALKIFEGGWLPLAMGATIFLLFATWKRGRNLMTMQLEASELPLQDFVDNLCAYPPAKVPGTAVFMSSSVSGVPHALLHNLKHNKVLHERVVFLTIRTEDIPLVSASERIQVAHLGTGFWQIQARYGFLETPDIPYVLEEGGEDCGLIFESMDTSYFLSRETLIASRHPGMPLWRVRLFSLMSRNALKATDFFKIPPNRVVEMGTQVEI
jgi:KUP system potassium uptake protein